MNGSLSLANPVECPRRVRTIIANIEAVGGPAKPAKQPTVEAYPVDSGDDHNAAEKRSGRC